MVLNKIERTSSPDVRGIGNVLANTSPPGKLPVPPSTSISVGGVSGSGGVDGIIIGDGGRGGAVPGAVMTGVAE